MTIEERLEVVERELAVSRRRTRRLWISLGLAGLVFALVWNCVATTGCDQAQGARKEIRANKFMVEDENGNGRAMLAADKDGSLLRLRDENEKTRAGLTVTKEGPVLELYDENGKVVWLEEFKDRADAQENINREVAAWMKKQEGDGK